MAATALENAAFVLARAMAFHLKKTSELTRRAKVNFPLSGFQNLRPSLGPCPHHPQRWPRPRIAAISAATIAISTPTTVAAAATISTNAWPVVLCLSPLHGGIGSWLGGVLIDEIGMVPRDFPNDLLHEVDQMEFFVKEVPNWKVSCRRELRPLLFITSNDERRLPSAFLRRCVTHHIELTDRLLHDAVFAHQDMYPALE